MHECAWVCVCMSVQVCVCARVCVSACTCVHERVCTRVFPSRILNNNGFIASNRLVMQEVVAAGLGHSMVSFPPLLFRITSPRVLPLVPFHSPPCPSRHLTSLGLTRCSFSHRQCLDLLSTLGSLVGLRHICVWRPPE